MSTTPACTPKHAQMFDSRDPWDHISARRICATCPLVTPCLLRAVEIANQSPPGAPYRGPDGTWGGLLWVNGQVTGLSDLRRPRRAAVAA